MQSETWTQELETTVVRGIEAGMAAVRSKSGESSHLVVLLHAGLTRLLTERPQLELRCAGHFLDFDGNRLPRGESDRVQTRRLVRALRAAGLVGLRIDKGLAVAELKAALEVLGHSGRRGDLWCEVPRRLRRAGVQHLVAIEAERGQNPHFPEGVGFSLHRAQAQRLYLDALHVSKRVLTDLQAEGGIDLHGVRRIVQRMADLCDEDDATLLGLTCIKSLEDYALTHAVNVTILSSLLARSAELPKRDVEQIGVAALLHDVGQIDVPREVLESAGTLTEEEWGSIRRHTLHGALRLLEAGPLEFTAPAALAALEHHLGVWGDGYPKLPSGWSTSVASKIVHIADTYDALTSRRVYRQHPVRPDRVLAFMLENAGMRFDPDLVKLFVQTLGIYPPGTAVELDGGAIGIVVRPNREPARLHRPQVCLLLDREGKPVEKDPLVDLAADERGIARCVDAETLELAPAAVFLRSA